MQALMSKLFDPITIRGITIRNRIGLSPMSMYAANDGIVGMFDLVHYGARAAGGAGLVFGGTAAVLPEGRITPGDPGLWSDAHAAAMTPVTHVIRTFGGTPGLQIGHAGRKAATAVPWKGGNPRQDGRSLKDGEGGWATVAPSALAFGGDKDRLPRELTTPEIEAVLAAFGAAAKRADAAGYDVLELHGAHGYLMHSFYSPITNKREDEWGGSFDNRIRLTLKIIAAVRANWPDHKPLSLRMAIEDFQEGGWTTEDAVALARKAVAGGVDMIDAMSFGGVAWGSTVPWGTNFQRAHAAALKKALPNVIVTTSAQTASDYATAPTGIEELVSSGDMDLALLGRQLLADPQWPAKAAQALGDDRLMLPANYEHWLTGRNPETAKA
jgi:2,4-dienoyl-CoA reductase-like NADH-dependent reductase (Old Yellow Enzyme family)